MRIFWTRFVTADDLPLILGDAAKVAAGLGIGIVAVIMELVPIDDGSIIADQIAKQPADTDDEDGCDAIAIEDRMEFHS